MRKFLALFLVVGMVFLLIGCGPKASLTIEEADKTVSLTVGQTKAIVPTVTGDKEVEWVSSNTAVATVSQTGVITAVGAGTATVTVSLKGTELSQDIAVTVVRPNPTAVTVTGAGSVLLGATLQLTGSVTPAAALQTLTWTSSNTAIATVSATGLVTAVAVGQVTITATSTLSTVKAEVTVNVVRPDPTTVTITGANEVMITENITLAAAVAPEFAVQGVQWSVDNTAIATITGAGVLTGVSGGVVTVRATSLAKATVFGEYTVTVKLPDPVSIVVSGPAAVPTGETGTYSAVVTPALAAQSVTWSVDDTALATITAEGVLTAVAVGTVKVIATSTVLNTIIGELEVDIELPRMEVEFELDGGYWPITGTDAFIDGEPVVTATLRAGYNPTSAEYYVAGDSSNHMNHIFLQDKDYKISPSVWQNRAFLNRNENGFFEVEAVRAAGSANTNPTLADYEYIIYAHEAYSAGYNFIGALQVGQVITLNGFDINALTEFEIGQIVINVYTKEQATSTEKLLAPGGVELELPIPGNFGFQFEGWYTNADFTGDPITKVSASTKVYAKWFADLSFIVVTEDYADGELFNHPVAGKDLVKGVNAFGTLAEALAVVEENGTVYIEDGTFDGTATLDKDGVTIIGSEDAIVAAAITVASGVDGLTIEGLTFTGGAKLVMNGGAVTNFTFQDNLVTKLTIGNNSFIEFNHSGTVDVNSNFNILNNIFEIGEFGEEEVANAPRWIRGGNIVDLTIVGNRFEGIKLQYVDAIRIEGDATSATAGATGAGGVLTISENEFVDIGQRAVWIRRYSATEIIVTDNYFVNCGDLVYGGGLQIEVFVQKADVTPIEPIGDTKMTIKFNVFEDHLSNFAIRLGSATYFAVDADINYNAFIGDVDHLPTHFIQGYAGATKINADYNFFPIADPSAKLANVASTANTFATLEDLATAIAQLKPQTVTFNTQGGSEVAEVEVPVGSKVTKPADPTRNGYEFAGWFLEAAGTNAFDFDTPIDAHITLYAKWTIVTYTLTYEYNGGALVYSTKNEMIIDFLTDLYAYVGATESLSDFMHGVDKTEGFDGLWHSNADYKNKIYDGGMRPTEADADAGFFITDPLYYDKWLPFFDMLNDFIKVVNSTQWFFAPNAETTPSTLVGLIRIRQYIINVKPAAYVTDAQMAMMPTFTQAIPIFTVTSAAVKLPTPVKEAYTFGGWYTTATFTAASLVTEIATGSFGNKTLYARWIPIEYPITYEYNGGAIAYETKNEMIIDFLTDLYAYVGATESLSDFMHGVDKTEGFDGLWHSNATYKNKIYDGGQRPTAPDNTLGFFITDFAYYDKWMPFFDNIHAFIKAVNPDQWFFAPEGTAASTFVGLIRIRQYIINVKPAAYVTDATMAMMPAFTVEHATYNHSKVTTLPIPQKDGFAFVGWFDNEDLTGDVWTEIPAGKMGPLSLYAKWETEVLEPTQVVIDGPDFLTVGETGDFSALVVPIAVDQTVTWTVSNTDIATISTEGVLTAVAYGKVNVVATAYNGVNVTFEVQVYAVPTSVSFSGPDVFVVGGTGTVLGVVNAATDTVAYQSVTYSSGDTDIFEVSALGVITPKAAGTAVLTITSTVDNTKTATRNITVHPADITTLNVTEVLVAPGFADKESFYSRAFSSWRTFIVGYNAFATLDEALAAVAADGTVYLMDGVHNTPANVAKNGITIKGSADATIAAAINVAANVEGLTITGLKFTGAGCVMMAAAGGIKDFTFTNNLVFNAGGDSATNGFIYFANNGTAINENFVITHNRFEAETEAGYSRYIRGGNVQNLTITNNYFGGIQFVYYDAIRIEGNNSAATAGIGAAGEVIISNNVFIDTGQRAVWLTRYSATLVEFNNNYIDFAGGPSGGGGVQLQNWVTGQTTAIEVKYNMFKNISDGYFAVRLNNTTSWTGAETWSADINYNALVDFGEFTGSTGTTRIRFFQAYATAPAAQALINAEYNYYSSSPLDELRMENVTLFGNAFDTLDELVLAIALLQADPTYGVPMMKEDFETFPTITSYTADGTVWMLGGLEWLTFRALMNPIASDLDANNDTKVVRIDGRSPNTGYFELKEFFDGITTFSFDAKRYGTNTTATLKVFKQVPDGDWVLVEDLTSQLTTAFQTFNVAINETGLVKVRFEVAVERMNIDNIVLYQSEAVFTDKFNESRAPQLLGEFTITTYDTSIWAGSGTNVYLDPNSTGGQFWDRFLISETEEAGVFEIVAIYPDGAVYTFNAEDCDYSIHVHSSNTAAAALILGMGLQVGDLITFPGTDLSTVAIGAVTILTQAHRLPGDVWPQP